jgi:predicted AAA+ superfamily ATPase
MIEREIYAKLLDWKNAQERKVLLLRGARQIGKTFIVRKLAASFNSSIEVNFLEQPEVAKFFQSGSLSPELILEKLQAYYGTTLTAGESLLFFDEIQECPEALTSLRFFYEKLGALHVIATGSLLEFALNEIPSFGVGRIESLYMYPINFEEFLGALGKQNLARMITGASSSLLIDSVLHKQLCELLKTYTLLGGLPAVIRQYLASRDLNKCFAIIDDILVAYQDDFAKYKTRISPLKLRAALLASAYQAGSKFVYSNINPGESISGYDQALELLRLAGLVYKIHNTSANGIPLGAEVDLRKFKVIPFDCGIYHRLLGLKASDILLDDQVSFINRGALAEVLCGIELTAHARSRAPSSLYYWNREAKSSNAEIDYIIQRGADIVPIEVKAGTKGQMQSLYKFLDDKKRCLGIRTSLENFSTINPDNSDVKIEVVPLYAIGRFSEPA